MYVILIFLSFFVSLFITLYIIWKKVEYIELQLKINETKENIMNEYVDVKNKKEMVDNTKNSENMNIVYIIPDKNENDKFDYSNRVEELE